MIGHATSLADWVIIAPVLLCLIGAAVLTVLRRRVGLQAYVAIAVLLAVIACDALLLQRVVSGGPLAMTMGKWLPPFGISFAADTLGGLLVLAAGLVTLVITLAMLAEAPVRAVRDGLYALVLLVLAGVNGAFLTGDLFNLYVWFEVMLIASFGLMVIGGRPVQLEATVKYAVLNVLATTLFLLALGLLYGLVGTLNMADIVGAARRADQPALVAVAALFTLAFSMKAAIFPANAWLPAAYHTPPATVSALMGALLTKVGLYAILRLLGMLLPMARQMLGLELSVVALATMAIGPLLAIGETSLRRTMGFLLIGGMGLALGGIANGAATALAGSATYLVHSMLTLGALYLLAGPIEGAGGADVAPAGLANRSPILAGALLLTLLAVAGVPPFLGFWPKLQLLQAGMATGDSLLVIGVLANAMFSLIAVTRLFSLTAWRPRGEAGAAMPAQPPLVRLLPALALSAAVALLGLFPSPLLRLVNLAVATILEPQSYITAVGVGP